MPLISAAHGSRRGCIVVRSSLEPCLPAPKPSMLQIGRKWPELQGARNWDGLLTPLDSALRSELIRYGEFVRAAYSSFDFNGGAPSYGSCRFPSCSLLRRAGLPETGYQVTRLLHVASTPAPGWLSPCSSSYIGYVAVCDDEDEIERLGRRDVVIAFRGMVTRSEWLEGFKSNLTRLPTANAGESNEEEDEAPMAVSGFWNLFTAPGEAHCSLQQQVLDEVRRIMREYGGTPPRSITIAGHSLGAALAVLSAYEITAAATRQGDETEMPMVTAVSFGGPRVGNAAFRRRLEKSGVKVLRVVNSDDIVTKVPGFLVDDDDRCGQGGEPPAKRMEGVPRWLVSKVGWGYSDVGRELRVSCQDLASNLAASHDLDLYLKLLAACTD
ncbi:unnamed protein product [Urochloa humidicola]